MKLILDVAIKKEVNSLRLPLELKIKKTNENQWSLKFYIINFTNVFALDNAILVVI